MIKAIFNDFSLFNIWGPLWLFAIIGIGYFYHKYIVQSKTYILRQSQIFFFYMSLILIYLLHGSPFSIIADHYFFSALMLQMSITYFVIIPLFIVGLPSELFKKYAWNHKLRLFIKIAGHPWLTLIIFNALFTIYFVPNVFNVIHPIWPLSFFMKLLLAVYAFFMWWTILNPVRRLNELGPLSRIFYIFLASLALMPIGFFFLLVLTAHYPIYQATEGQLFPVMTAVYDQQLAGGLLKLIQLSSFIIAMYQIVKAWAKRMEEQEGETLEENYRVVQGVVIRTNQKQR